MISAEQHNENTGSVTVQYSLPTVPCSASWRNEKVMYPLSRGFHVRTRVLSKDQRKAQQRHYVKLQYMYQQRNLTLSRKLQEAIIVQDILGYGDWQTTQLHNTNMCKCGPQIFITHPLPPSCNLLPCIHAQGVK